MQMPAPWQVLFALKAFTAAMLALYIAFSLDLPNPYWAMTTVFVVSQPYAGAIRSKGVYRLGGTLMGGAMGVALFSIFGSFQFPMMLSLVAWLCFCGYFALSDRTPRSYFFLLAGLTALLVGWPGSAVTGSIFDTAVARVLEISLGIVCTVLVDSIVFPRRIEPVLEEQIDTWFEDARRLSLDVLAENNDALTKDRRQLAADAGQISVMAVHLDYEGRQSARSAGWIRVLQQRMIQILPVLSSIRDRLAELRRSDAAGDGRLPAGLDAVLGELRAWIDAGMPRKDVERIRELVVRAEPKAGPGASWSDVLGVSLFERLREFVEIVDDCESLRLQSRGNAGASAPVRLRLLRKELAVSPHKDRGLVVWSIATALCSFSIAATFWYATGWPQGSSATLFALLMCLFFGAVDNPVPILRTLVKVLLFAVVLDTLYLFVILPSITSFPTLVLAFAPALIPLAIVASNPATFMVALMPIALLTLSDSANTSTFEPFLNGMIGTFAGVLIVLAVTSVLKQISAEISAKRLLHAGWRDIERIASQRDNTDPGRFMSLMLDRLGLLVPRLATVDDEGLSTTNALSDLRLGLNLIALQKRRLGLPPALRRDVDSVLGSLASHFNALRRGRATDASAEMLAKIDRTLEEAMAQPEGGDKNTVILTLAGIRRAVFPAAEPYRARSVPSHEGVQFAAPAMAAE